MVELRSKNGTSDWETPQDFLNALCRRFERCIGLDAAASSMNALANKYFSADELCAFKHPWLCQPKHELVYCNPPYGRCEDKWVERARNQFIAHNREHTIVMLLPAKTGKTWFQRASRWPCCDIILLKGRLSFIRPGKGTGEEVAPFASCLLVFRPASQGHISCENWKDW